MQQTLSLPRRALLIRAAWILAFTLLTIVSARLRIETGTGVPFTMQVFATLLAGMVLGARDGALSQLAYVGLIAAGLPVDTNMLGAAAFFGPTGGYLVGFVVGAAVTGYLTERAGTRLWQRWLAGLVGVAVIYLFGATHLMLYTGRDLLTAVARGVAPFILYDFIKALLAAGLAETLRARRNRRKTP
ncbi:MAG: biotin transporter BioY [Anaerolineae bacterium]|nr:biotin transporter BioY [Anaerolineae bacterium]